jgi:hypothetical protein
MQSGSLRPCESPIFHHRRRNPTMPEPSLSLTDAIGSAYLLLNLASNSAFDVVSLPMLPPLYASKESARCLIILVQQFSHGPGTY